MTNIEASDGRVQAAKENSSTHGPPTLRKLLATVPSSQFSSQLPSFFPVRREAGLGDCAQLRTVGTLVNSCEGDLESELMLDSGLDSNALHTAAVLVIISSACWAVMAFEGAGRPRGTSVSSSTCFRTSGREVRDLTATEVLDGPPSHRSRTTADGFRPLATPPRPRCCRLQRRPPPSACPSRPGYANRSPARRSTARAQPPATRPSSPPSAGLLERRVGESRVRKGPDCSWAPTGRPPTAEYGSQIKRGLQPRRAGLRVLVALRASPVPHHARISNPTLRPRSTVSRLAYSKEAMTDRRLSAMSPQQMSRS